MGSGTEYAGGGGGGGDERLLDLCHPCHVELARQGVHPLSFHKLFILFSF